MTVRGAQEMITNTVTSWEGVMAEPHRFGGVEYVIGKREIGHIHGDHLVDIPFPKKVRDEIVQMGRAQAHHILPESGWVSFYLREPEDIERAITLLTESFQIAKKQKNRYLVFDNNRTGDKE
jgi:predicted DNA-binding protein (MmcQ/YjbR family)